MTRLVPWIGPGLLWLLPLGFLLHAGGFGIEGLRGPPAEPTRLWTPSTPVANVALFAHMLGGAVVMALAPLQILGPLRRARPRWHRAAGYGLVGAACVTALGGLWYIGLRGTIGGPAMSVAFAAYGLCFGGAALATVRAARQRDFARHRRWALRLVVLAFGSWLYRVQYGLWYGLTDGLWSDRAFSQPFDLFMNWGFFVPWLLMLEIWMRQSYPRASPSGASDVTRSS